MGKFKFKTLSIDQCLLHPFLNTLLAGLLSTSVFSVQAQELNKTALIKSDPLLDTIYVSASRRTSKVEDMPLYTSIISQRDIEASSAKTLDQVLKNIPGLNFTAVPSTQSDPTGQSTKMRGLGNAKVLVLLDGIPVMDPFYLTTQWFKMPLSTIERVEVVRGGNSSLWGNMAVAGVINVVTKRAKDDSAELDLSWGSRGSSEVAISKNFRPSERWGFNFAVQEQSSKGYVMTPSDQIWRFPQKNTIDAKDSNLQFTSFYTPSADLKAYLRIGTHIQDQSINYNFGQNIQKSPDLSFNVLQNLDSNSTLSTSFWHQWVDFNKYNGASCYWQSNSSTKCPSSSSLNTAQVNNNIVQYYTQLGLQNYSENGASSILSMPLGNTFRDMQVGLDWRQLRANDQEWFYAAPQSLSALQNLSSTTTGSGTQTFAGLFAQTRVTPVHDLDALELTLSARLDHYSNTQRQITRTSVGQSTMGGPQDDSTKTAINPSLAARYALSENTALRAATYKSFRAPGFNNTLRTYGSPNPTIANPDLSPETLFGKELGLDYAVKDLTLSATYFVYNIKDMIATSNYQYLGANNVNNSPFIPSLVQNICSGPTLSSCGGKATFYSNAQDGQSKGFELSAMWSLSPGLKVDASLSKTSSVLTKNQVSTAPLGVQIAGLPWNMANLGFDWAMSSQTKLYVQAHYTGKMLIDTTTTLGQVYDQGGVTVVNASIKHTLDKDTDLSLYATNLFNRLYSENAYTYNQPWSATLSEPQTFHLTLRKRF